MIASSAVAARGPSTIRLQGEIDCASAEAAGTEIRLALAAGAGYIDFSELTFIDVAGIRALALAIRDHNASVVFDHAHPLMERCWYVAGFHKVAPTAIFVVS